MIHQLNLENLSKLEGGKIAVSLLKHLMRAALDCEDRPLDPKARTVLVQFDMEPVPDLDTRECDEVKMQVHVSSKVPAHRSKEFSCGLRKGGILTFNEDAPDNINQSTMLDDERDGR